MAFLVRRFSLSPPRTRSFRSEAALEALSAASSAKTANLVLYNYPSISGAFSAVFANIYHCRLNLPCLILPFSQIAPFSVGDVIIEGLERCFLLDFVGPKGFALQLSKEKSCEVISFDHRKSVIAEIPPKEEFDGNLKFHINLEKSSAVSVYDYFSSKLSGFEHRVDDTGLFNANEQHRIERLLDYIGDRDLHKGAMPDIEAFNIGIRDWYSKLNCITNALMYEQLTEMNVVDVIAKGNSYLSARRATAKIFLDKVGRIFKVRLGRGLYGDCLGIRADDNPDLKDELGEELCQKSAEAGLRPIGAVIYMQRKNLKMCLRSNDGRTDVSEIAKAYGGGGSQKSSSFIIRMDEYNQWLSMH
ncbi:hypothetical protein Leryth_000140 [Lithospermum erythrorhizon]|nr:hypothetical protein Leryth_000140 [Lithospermum erythrorhizon]